MLLSEIPKEVGVFVIRNGVFSHLSFSENARAGSLVPITKLATAVHLRKMGVSAIFATTKVAEHVPDYFGVALSEDPYGAFAAFHEYLCSTSLIYDTKNKKSVISSSAQIECSAVIADKGVSIGDHVYIGPGAVIESGVAIGEFVRIEAGVYIGGEGLPPITPDGRPMRLRFAGSVEIHKEAKILANAVVARGLFGGATVIGEGVVIGAHCFVSHDVNVGAGSLIGHGARVLGNTTIREGVNIGCQAVVLDELTIGEKVHILPGAVVIESIGLGQKVSGNFARNHHIRMREYISVSRRTK